MKMTRNSIFGLHKYSFTRTLPHSFSYVLPVAAFALAWELRSCDRDHIAHRPKIFITWPCTGKLTRLCSKPVVLQGQCGSACPGGLVKMQIAGPHPSGGFSRSGQGWRTCISRRIFQGQLMPLLQGSRWEPLLWTAMPCSLLRAAGWDEKGLRKSLVMPSI